MGKRGILNIELYGSSFVCAGRGRAQRNPCCACVCTPNCTLYVHHRSVHRTEVEDHKPYKNCTDTRFSVHASHVYTALYIVHSMCDPVTLDGCTCYVHKAYSWRALCAGGCGRIVSCIRNTLIRYGCYRVKQLITNKGYV